MSAFSTYFNKAMHEHTAKLREEMGKLMEPDMVNRPPHYQGKVETIDAIEAALGPAGFVAYCRGNAIKYLSRAGKKGELREDLAKAQWYVARALSTLADPVSPTEATPDDLGSWFPSKPIPAPAPAGQPSSCSEDTARCMRYESPSALTPALLGDP